MTILQYLKQGNKNQLSQAKEFTVREIEALSKGVWEGFVDDKQDSLAVLVNLSGSKISEINCECQAGFEPCVHKYAMLLSLREILQGQKTSSKSLLNKKAPKQIITQAQALLQDKDKDLVYNWLLELFAKNKEIEQNFIVSFQDNTPYDYTGQWVITTMDAAYKSIIGKSKRVDATLLKSLVALLELSLDGMLKNLPTVIYKKETLDIFTAVFVQVEEFKFRMDVSVSRLQTFAKKFTLNYTRTLLNVKDRVLVKEALVFLMQQICTERDYLKQKAYAFLLDNIVQEADLNYREFLALESIEVLNKDLQGTLTLEPPVKYTLLQLFVSTDAFKNNYTLFEPILFENKYNQALIKHLLEVDLNLSEHFALACIANNVKKVYNKPYQELLLQIYAKQGNKAKQALLLSKNVVLCKSVEDYVFVREHLENQKDFLKFYNSYLEYLLSNHVNSKEDFLLAFQVLDQDFQYGIMLDLVSFYTFYSVLNLYLKPLKDFDSKKLLDKVLRIGEYDNFQDEPLEDVATFFVENYPTSVLLKDKRVKNAQDNSLNQLIGKLALQK